MEPNGQTTNSPSRGPQLHWARAFSAGIFIFVYSMTFVIIDPPEWQHWVVLGVAVLSLVVFSWITVRSRNATPALDFDGAAALFVAVSGVVVLLICAGSRWWGYSVAWAVVATGLFVPGSLFFVYQRWSGARRRAASAVIAE